MTQDQQAQDQITPEEIEPQWNGAQRFYPEEASKLQAVLEGFEASFKALEELLDSLESEIKEDLLATNTMHANKSHLFGVLALKASLRLSQLSDQSEARYLALKEFLNDAEMHGSAWARYPLVYFRPGIDPGDLVSYRDHPEIISGEDLSLMF